MKMNEESYGKTEENLGKSEESQRKQARKPQCYASSKLSPTYLLRGVRCRATSVAKNEKSYEKI